MEGLSVKSLLKANQQSKVLTDQLNDRTIFTHRILDDPQINLWGAINRHWSMIEFQDGKMVLFDHRNDLSEKHDVFGGNPEITGKLIAKLEHFKVHGRRLDIESTPINMDQELIDSLRTLGYVGE